MNAIYLKATTANGVEIIDIIDYPELDMMKPKDFLEELKWLSEGEERFTAVMPKGTDGEYEMIDDAYGIN